jgi:hypothetical protein
LGFIGLGGCWQQLEVGLLRGQEIMIGLLQRALPPSIPYVPGLLRGQEIGLLQLALPPSIPSVPGLFRGPDIQMIGLLQLALPSSIPESHAHNIYQSGEDTIVVGECAVTAPGNGFLGDKHCEQCTACTLKPENSEQCSACWVRSLQLKEAS